jgi:hypothetical protein
MSKITAGTGFEKEETTDINYTYDKGKKKRQRLIPADIACRRGSVERWKKPLLCCL